MMKPDRNPLFHTLHAQSRQWSTWVSAGMALTRCSSVPTILGTLSGWGTGGTVATWALPTLAGLGAVQSLSAATTISYAPSLTAGKLTVKQGDPFNLSVVINSTAHGSARSYTLSGNVPAGITPQEGQSYDGITLKMTGTPTEAGTFSIGITGWAKTGGKGDHSPVYTFTLVVQPAASPPSITLQPANSQANWGGTAQFTATVANATSLRWRRNGVALDNGNGVSGATTATLSLSGLTSADDGATFALAVTGQNGTTIVSQTVQLSVASTPYALWREQQFTPTDWFNEAVSGSAANPDGDTRNNGLEFALGSDPFGVDPSDPFERTIEVGAGNTTLRLTFPVNPAARPSDLLVESTTNTLDQSWTPVDESLVDRSTAGQWVVHVPIADASRFLRLRATP